jgi:hypothetical protein
MCFADQLHRNVEAYMDNMVVKTRNPEGLIEDLEETFASLRKYRWKLNPTKCVFGVPSGKLLGFIVSNRGIEALKRLPPSLIWRHLPQSKMCRNLQAAWQLSTDSSPGSGREDYLFSDS